MTTAYFLHKTTQIYIFCAWYDYTIPYVTNFINPRPTISIDANLGPFYSRSVSGKDYVYWGEYTHEKKTNSPVNMEPLQ